MSKYENKISTDKLSSIEPPLEPVRNDPLDLTDQLDSLVIPHGVDRRTFLMRSAVIGAAVVITGSQLSCQDKTSRATAPAPSAEPKGVAGGPGNVELSPSLNVVKEQKGPVMTTLDEFYKVGPGPSSSHTIGPMRITYDFYQRCTKLPADQLAKATALKVNLFGSLSATGKGHGTERASLAGLIGKEPATVDPAFLDGLRDNPDQSFPVKLGAKTVNVSLKDVVFDAVKGDFPHPNTMTCKLMAGDTVLLEQEYYSVGGGFIEWKGYTPPKKNPPKYPFSTMKELRQHADQNNLTIAQVILANEMAIPGRSQEEVYAFIDKITNAMVATVKSGLAAPEDSVLPGPIKLHSKAATVYKRAMDDKYQTERGIGVVSAYALAGSEENGRGHLVITAPTGGSAGVMPAVVYALGEGGRKLPGGQNSTGHACCSSNWLPMQAQCNAICCRGRLPGGNRCGIGNGSGIGRNCTRRGLPSRRERRGVRIGASPGNDLRSGGRICSGSVHRAMRIRRGQGMDRLCNRHE